MLSRSSLKVKVTGEKVTITGGKKSSAIAGMADRGVARAENK